MSDFENFEDAQQLTEEQYKKTFGEIPRPKKPKPKPKPQARRVPTTSPATNEEDLMEPEEFDVDDEDEMFNMRKAEHEVAQRHLIEYQEKVQSKPESAVEMDNKLIEIDARMSQRKELIDAIDSTGTRRKTAITLEEDYPEIFTSDMVKANYEENETASVFGNMSLINSMKALGQAKDFEFIDACRFNKNQMDAITNLTRGKRGFSSILVKTDKHVSEGVVSHVQKAFQEKKTKRWGLM